MSVWIAVVAVGAFIVLGLGMVARSGKRRDRSGHAGGDGGATSGDSGTSCDGGDGGGGCD